MSYKLYSLDNEFLEETDTFPDNFTGIIVGRFKYKSKDWYLNGKLHRINGPAVEYKYGENYYWIHGIRYTKKQHKLLVDTMKLKGLL